MFKENIFFITFFLLSLSYFAAEGQEKNERETVENRIEEKQENLEKQRTQKAIYESELRESEQRAQEAQRKLDELGWTGWGLSKLTGGAEYDKLMQAKNEALSEQQKAQANINSAQQQIEHTQQDMADLAKNYVATVPMQDISVLQNQMNEALRDRDFNSFNQNLQQVLAKTENLADKFSQISNVIDRILKEYPTDLTAQVDALKKTELSFNLVLGDEYRSPAYKQVMQKIEDARAQIQEKIDERSSWAQALVQKNISDFKKEFNNVYRGRVTGLEKRILIRDAFKEISQNFSVGSAQWIDLVDELFVYAEGIPTEKEGLDLKQEILSLALDEVVARLEAGSSQWDDALNALWTYDVFNGEIQKRIEAYLSKQKIKSANLDELLKTGKLADYLSKFDMLFSTMESADAKRLLLQDQLVVLLGHYDTANYTEQMQALSILGALADPKKFDVAYREKIQPLFQKITGRLNVIVDRINLGYENLEQVLKGAAGDWDRMRVLDEEIYTAKNLIRDVQEDLRANYADQTSMLKSIKSVIDAYKGDAYTLLGDDIDGRLNEIANFKPQKPSNANKLEIELSLWQKLPDDQIIALKQKYNDVIDQLRNSLDDNNASRIKDAQEVLENIRIIIDTYGLAQRQMGFKNNIETAIQFANNLVKETKLVEMTQQEKNVLSKVISGEQLTSDEAALLAGIGTKKVLSFIVDKITPEVLANADTVASMLEKAPNIANAAGKVMTDLEGMLALADSWYVKVLLAGPTLVTQRVGAPIAKQIFSTILGEKTVNNIQATLQKGGQKVSDTFFNLVEFSNSDIFKESAQALGTSGKVIKSVTSLLDGLSSNIDRSASSQAIESLPPKEQLDAYDASISLARRLDQLGSMEPNLAFQEKQQQEKKDFFAKIKDQFTNFVVQTKSWITKLFTDDGGISALEKRFTQAQEAYKRSSTSANAQALVEAAGKLHNAYQEVTVSIASFQELGRLWNNVVMDVDVALALEKDSLAINRDVLDQVAAKVFEAKAYSAAFSSAIAEIGDFFEKTSKGTSLEVDYQKMLSDIVLKDYVTILHDYQQKIDALNTSFVRYQALLEEAIKKTKGAATGQQGILGGERV